MKKMMIATFIVVTLISTSMPALAEEEAGAMGAMEETAEEVVIQRAAEGADAPRMSADVIIARPVGLVSTVVGTALFIVALPFTIPSGSVAPVARALVAAPFKFTFTRPVGDFSSLEQ